MPQIAIINPFLHFDFSTASGNVVLAREIARCISEYSDIIIITGKHKEMEYPNIFSGSFSCYRSLSSAIVEKVDVIHLLDIPIPLLPVFYRKAKSMGAKIIYHVWTFPISNSKLLIYAMMLQRFTDAIACTSPRILKVLRRFIYHEKLWLIPPPIDTNIYKPIAYAKSIDQPLILYIGPLHPARFPVTEVFKTLKRLHKEGLKISLAIIAAPRYAFDSMIISKLKILSEKIGLKKYVNVIYRRISLDEKVKLYNSADIILFPYEPFVKGVVDPPLTLLEAMSCARLVLATNVLSIPYIIKNKINGFLCSAPKTLCLYSSIKEVFEMNEYEKERIRREARNTIQCNFSFNYIQITISKLYNYLNK